MVLLTPVPRGALPPRVQPRAPPPPKSAGARQAAPHPVYPPPSVLHFLISLPFFLQRNRTPAPPVICRLQGTRHLTPSPTPFHFFPTLYPCPETSKHPAVLALLPTLILVFSRYSRRLHGDLTRCLPLPYRWMKSCHASRHRFHWNISTEPSQRELKY